MAKPLNIGFCGGCETAIFKKIGLKTVPNENYAEVSIIVSSGAHARHGVCKVCAGNMTPELMTKIFERIQATWGEEMATFSPQEQIEGMKKLKVETFGESEEHALKLYDEKKEKQRKEKLKVLEQKDNGDPAIHTEHGDPVI